MSTDEIGAGFYYDLVAKEDFEELIGRVGDYKYFRAWENENVKLEANPDEPDNNYSFSLQALYIYPGNIEYVEGQIEGVVINCKGDHFSENDDAEFRLTLGHKKIQRIRLAISVESSDPIVAVYDEDNNEIGRSSVSSGWFDFKVPLPSSHTIARVSLFMKVSFGGPRIDSLEMWKVAPIPTTDD